MNDPLESTDSDQPLHDQPLHDQPLGEGLPTSLEQQLRAFRPRAPQLQMDLIAQNASQAWSQPAVQVAVAPQRTGLTYRQMIMALAASWLLGAVVGGGGIFWSMSSRQIANEIGQPTPNVANSTQAYSSQTNSNIVNRPEPQPAESLANSASSARHQRPNDVPEPLGDAALRAALELSAEPWYSDEPLGVRSLATAKLTGRLTAVRPKAMTQNPSAASRDLDSTDSSSTPTETFVPDPLSNRQQLLELYLKESDQQVY